MKQHILPKQAQEVTEEEFYSIFNGDVVVRKDWYKFHHKKITIGLMIEFLHNRKWNLKITRLEILNTFNVSNDEVNGTSYYRDELCDALWEAVKCEITKREDV